MSIRSVKDDKLQVSIQSVQWLSRVRLSVSPWTTAGFPVHHQFREFTQTHVHWWWCHPTISSSVVPFSSRLQSFSESGFFSNESALLIRWSKYWSFSFSISHSNKYSGLISFRMDWLDLLVVQGTLKSILQYHRSKASVLRFSAFFLVQLSHLYMITGKTIALTTWPLSHHVSAF